MEIRGSWKEVSKSGWEFYMIACPYLLIHLASLV
jgi:hypothetical protein